ncbi:MAG: CCA tRNA nucleotidyltransferase [Cyanobacteria bacterium SIG26]|nr:CCA tRNA nucleotidyltransferase [Cyanobacteria bacterium SIG26]
MNIQTLADKIKNDALLNNLISFFSNEIYLVGGSVRDALMGIETHDRDLIVTDIDAKDFSEQVAVFFSGTLIPLDETNKIYRVVLPDKINYFDITNPVENSLKKDILRRDLTINAVAINIRTGEIIDYCQGLNDIQTKTLKAVCEQNFIDDPLRILRLFRFYSILGFKIHPQTYEYIKKHNHLISNPAKERIQYEIMKLFSGEYAHETLLKMDECGLLELLFPFVKELKQVPPNLHHHLNLFHHSVETVKQVGILYKNSTTEVSEHLNKIDFGGFSRIAHLRLAAFMHDIGKFATWTIEEDTGRHRFIKHEDVGAKQVIPLLKQMCFSNKQIEYIAYIIKKHMYPTAVVSAPEVNEKVMMRYVRKSEACAIDNIIIAQADRLSALGPEITQEIVTENITSLNKLLKFYLEAKDTLSPIPKLLNGNEVMEILNIKPSPLLGEILNALNEAQISGDIITKEQAMDFVKNFSS